MLHNKMIDLINDVNKTVCEREELIRLIAVAMLSKNNLFILGETGQAKSFAVNQFRKRIEGAKQFEKLMSKQTDEEVLFGRLDLSSIIPGNVPESKLTENNKYCELKSKLEKLLENSDNLTNDTFIEMKELTKEATTLRKAISECTSLKPEMVTTGKIPDSHIVFLDEIFKSSDGILNSLLTALNEKVWTNEGEVVQLPVISFFSASNEIPNFNNPEEKILKPLYDRFQLKVLTQYVEDRNNRLNMLKSLQNNNNNLAYSTITIDELYEMQNEVKAIIIPDKINQLMDTVLCELRRKNIAVSDRKFFNYGSIVQAEAWLDGKNIVNENHLMIMVNYLWNTPQEIEIVQSTLEALCRNPISAELDEIIASALESYEQFETSDDKLKAFGKFRKELVRLFERTQELIIGVTGNQTVIDNVNQIVDKLDDMNKKASDTLGFTFVKLAELIKLN